MSVLDWMGEHPILTIVVIAIVLESFVRIVRGYPRESSDE